MLLFLASPQIMLPRTLCGRAAAARDIGWPQARSSTGACLAMQRWQQRLAHARRRLRAPLRPCPRAVAVPLHILTVIPDALLSVRLYKYILSHDDAKAQASICVAATRLAVQATACVVL